MLSNVNSGKNCKKISPTKNKRTLEAKLRNIHIPVIKQKRQYGTVKIKKDQFHSIFFHLQLCDIGKSLNKSLGLNFLICKQ